MQLEYGGNHMFTKVQTAIARLERLIADARSHARRPFDCSLAIVWRDRNGMTTYARARGLDVSDNGARIQYSEPIPLAATILVQDQHSGFRRAGIVRYSTRSGSKYAIGIEFDDTVAAGGLLHQPGEQLPGFLRAGFPGEPAGTLAAAGAQRGAERRREQETFKGSADFIAASRVDQ